MLKSLSNLIQIECFYFHLNEMVGKVFKNSMNCASKFKRIFFFELFQHGGARARLVSAACILISCFDILLQ